MTVAFALLATAAAAAKHIPMNIILQSIIVQRVPRFNTAVRVVTKQNIGDLLLHTRTIVVVERDCYLLLCSTGSDLRNAYIHAHHHHHPPPTSHTYKRRWQQLGFRDKFPRMLTQSKQRSRLETEQSHDWYVPPRLTPNVHCV